MIHNWTRSLLVVFLLVGCSVAQTTSLEDRASLEAPTSHNHGFHLRHLQKDDKEDDKKDDDKDKNNNNKKEKETTAPTVPPSALSTFAPTPTPTAFPTSTPSAAPTQSISLRTFDIQLTCPQSIPYCRQEVRVRRTLEDYLLTNIVQEDVQLQQVSLSLQASSTQDSSSSSQYYYTVWYRYEGETIATSRDITEVYSKRRVLLQVWTEQTLLLQSRQRLQQVFTNELTVQNVIFIQSIAEQEEMQQQQDDDDYLYTDDDGYYEKSDTKSDIPTSLIVTGVVLVVVIAIAGVTAVVVSRYWVVQRRTVVNTSKDDTKSTSESDRPAGLTTAFVVTGLAENASVVSELVMHDESVIEASIVSVLDEEQGNASRSRSMAAKLLSTSMMSGEAAAEEDEVLPLSTSLLSGQADKEEEEEVLPLSTSITRGHGEVISLVSDHSPEGVCDEESAKEDKDEISSHDDEQEGSTTRMEAAQIERDVSSTKGSDDESVSASSRSSHKSTRSGVAAASVHSITSGHETDDDVRSRHHEEEVNESSP